MSKTIRSYRDLQVWQLAMDMAEEAYSVTRSYLRDELFGMTSQTRRAATSVAANIAEGHGRGTRAAYANFLRIARGSLRELETQFLLAQRIGLVPSERANNLLERADELGRKLHVLLARLSEPATSLAAPRSPLPAPQEPA